MVYFEPGKWTCNTRLAGMVSSLITHVWPFLIGGAPKLHRYVFFSSFKAYEILIFVVCVLTGKTGHLRIF